ncbi:hypothetical protein GGTG_13660 [Gaeumannomyces tritici R3-111a-1]|uniref:AAA+ ATPase domain-containing protein n=1 Tax=Gaeumannomyces tritici (strain R3-111a-1) TaxID=644352 RepID=J3PJH8_GAET3|nr:hypothetical protein GGTG_13660 [Gaeumannomyces tritici R3-111a-1]EJT68769.1 hypothetical protein GGTG_13660 [Gaeumannomyces tritici R3-111a-1]
MENITSSLPPLEDATPMGIFQAVLGRLPGGLNVTQTSSILTLTAFAFGTLRWLHGSTSSFIESLRDYVTIRVTIPGSNEMSTFVSEWIDRNILPKSYNKSFLFREALHDCEDEFGDGEGYGGGSVPIFFDEHEGDEGGESGEGGEGGEECVSLIKKKAQRQTDRPIECVPQFKRTWFFFRGYFFTVRKGAANSNSNGDDDDDNEDVGASAMTFTKEGQSLTITCVSHSSKPVVEFLKMCREEARTLAAGSSSGGSGAIGGALVPGQNKPQMRIYCHDYRYWRFKCKAPARPLSSIHLDREIKRDLLDDFEKYLSPITRRRYQARSMPYQRGYLLHGPPGTGKSTLASVLAGRYGLSLYILKLAHIDDEDLERLFSELPSRCIVLMEDIDAAGIDRDDDSDSDSDGDDNGSEAGGSSSKKKKKNKEKEENAKAKRKTSDCTLSGLLNVLDGVGSQEGRVVIMTTNYPDELDSALVRPGRIDKKVYIGHINRRSAHEMFMRMFRPTVGGGGKKVSEKDSGDLACRCDECRATTVAQLAADFGRLVPDGCIAPSELQGFFQVYLECPSEAVRSFPAWLWRLREDKVPRKKRQQQQQQQRSLAGVDGVLTPPETPVSEKADKAEEESEKGESEEKGGAVDKSAS